MDFGLAKQLAAPAEAAVSLTQEVIGTLPYMSPEQARGNPDEIDTRTDIYALGVILYEMMTGHYPYPVAGQMADVLRHIAENMRGSRRKALFEWNESDFSGFDRKVTADNVLGPQDIDEWEISKYIASSQLYNLAERDPEKELAEGTEFGLIHWDIDAILEGLVGSVDR